MKASQRNRPVTERDIERIKRALDALIVARADLREAAAHNAANYVQRCIKSAQGALNNARAHYNRARDRGIS